MVENITKMQAEHLLEYLDEKDSDSGISHAESIIQQHKQQGNTLRFRVSSTVVAFIAAACCIAFLNAIHLFTVHNPNTLIVGGVISMSLAFLLQRYANHDRNTQYSFMMISSYACMIVGKILLVLGLYNLFHHLWVICLSLCMVSGITYYHYEIPSERFLSVFVALSSIPVYMFDSSSHNLDEMVWGINGFFVFQFICAAMLQLYGKAKHGITPLFYALLCSLIISTHWYIADIHTRVTTASPLAATSNIYTINYAPFFVNVVLAVAILVLSQLVSVGMEVQYKKRLFLFGSVVAVSLGVMTTPGILLSITLLMLGFAKYQIRWIQAGVGLFLYFVYQYLFSLGLTLTELSLCWIGGGVIFLIAWQCCKNCLSTPIAADKKPSCERTGIKQVILIISSVLVLGVLNYGLYQQEQAIISGYISTTHAVP